MLFLRYAYVLALALWIGGMIVLGAVVAPTIFQVLPIHAPDAGRALAGVAFGAMLARFHLVAYAAGAVMLAALGAMALLGPRPRHLAVRMAIVAGMLGVALYSGRVVLGEIETVQQQVATAAPRPAHQPDIVTASLPTLPSQLPAGDARRERFDELHRLSTRLMMINVAGALVLLFWEAREH
jgi:uncharacterized membrane protein